MNTQNPAICVQTTFAHLKKSASHLHFKWQDRLECPHLLRVLYAHCLGWDKLHLTSLESTLSHHWFISYKLLNVNLANQAGLFLVLLMQRTKWFKTQRHFYMNLVSMAAISTHQRVKRMMDKESNGIWKSSRNSPDTLWGYKKTQLLLWDEVFNLLTWNHEINFPTKSMIN